MGDAKGFAKDWLVNDFYRTKALIKYTIKHIENRLQKAMGDGKNTRMRIADAAQCCSELALRYEELLNLLKPTGSQEPNVPSSLSENSPSRCYITIQTLKQQFNSSMTLSDEIRMVRKLKFYYQLLQEQLNRMQPQSLEYIQRSLTGQLKILIESQSCAEWLHATVAFANDSGENILSALALLAKLDDTEILQLASLFKRPEIIFTINNLFFYKSNPHQLFKQALHPEKLLSVKARLSMLHQFIESMHQTIMQSLKQRGLGELHDYLLHGDDLPQGITVAIEEEIHKLIITALKEWRLPNIILSDELVAKNKLNNLFRAYKFWFNPNRLIDTVMALQQQSGHNCDTSDDCMKFSAYVQELFQQLSTTECLDLYGYFSNKDSCYLMRSLVAVLEDQKIAALPLATQVQKEAIGRVFHTLDCTMEALRQELLNRHINTAPYSRSSTHKPLKPGRRNLEAISRIMALYANPPVLENKTLEQLFQEVGGHI
ncbi:hypothetical protein [Legionella jamestowniensis]|uniref:Uncharacterized protein n=1 Tax=Legionella jamestowniensis TaxID=455 RepID=A0A0W0UJJ5_9GAMM|nr:hypothetical protein [Legionella jamestowniensis]KTD08080.1 hypothetical protein Ljam_2275 [Legionella jamestowniensis]OCH97358.1 hypothetical protein A8135_03640 [Legionella jamestowniensis]SFM05559.1 hypothetical protein SAMN02746073_0157 [Legionella jamestowniensis DSM 19215]